MKKLFFCGLIFFSNIFCVKRFTLHYDQVPVSEENLQNIHFFNQNGITQWVKEKASTISSNALVLDVGAGSCPYKEFFNHCHYVTQDFAKNEVHVRYGKIDIVSDINSIPLPDEYADYIICIEVLEHVPEPIKALSEMARLLKSGGKLFLTAPLGSGLHQEPFHFYGGYTPHFYKKFLPEMGMEIISIQPNGGYFKHLAQECVRLSWNFEKFDIFVTEQEKKDFRYLFNEFLPRILFKAEEKNLWDAFAVGFFVEAVKL